MQTTTVVKQTQSVVCAIANSFTAYLYCCKTGNAEWQQRHLEKVHALVKEYMPSGSGFDNGTTLDVVQSRADCLVFNTSYHAMDEHGSYDGWYAYTVRVRPRFSGGVDISVQGRDYKRTELKEYVVETFNAALVEEVAK